MFALDLGPRAERGLKRLGHEDRRRVSNRIDRLLIDPRGPGTKQLRGRPIQFSARVGNYRIIYEIDSGAEIVSITDIDLRDRVYRRIR